MKNIVADYNRKLSLIMPKVKLKISFLALLYYKHNKHNRPYCERDVKEFIKDLDNGILNAGFGFLALQYKNGSMVNQRLKGV